MVVSFDGAASRVVADGVGPIKLLHDKMVFIKFTIDLSSAPCFFVVVKGSACALLSSMSLLTVLIMCVIGSTNRAMRSRVSARPTVLFRVRSPSFGMLDQPLRLTGGVGPAATVLVGITKVNLVLLLLCREIPEALQVKAIHRIAMKF